MPLAVSLIIEVFSGQKMQAKFFEEKFSLKFLSRIDSSMVMLRVDDKIIFDGSLYAVLYGSLFEAKIQAKVFVSDLLTYANGCSGRHKELRWFNICITIWKSIQGRAMPRTTFHMHGFPYCTPYCEQDKEFSGSLSALPHGKPSWAISCLGWPSAWRCLKWMTQKN